MFAPVPPNLVTKWLKPSPVAGRMGVSGSATEYGFLPGTWPRLTGPFVFEVAGRGRTATHKRIAMSVSSTESVRCEVREAFHKAVWLYADWTPSLPEPMVRLGGICRSMSAVCGLVAEFNDRLPDDVFDRLMIYMRDIRYTLLRQKIFAEHSYAEGGRCFLRLIEDRKRQRR
jgi:hypothetical protein